LLTENFEHLYYLNHPQRQRGGSFALTTYSRFSGRLANGCPVDKATIQAGGCLRLAAIFAVFAWTRIA